MRLASISAMSGCACLPWRICLWDLKLRLNFFHPDATSGFEDQGRFVIALCIYMESSFGWAQIRARKIGQTQPQFRAAKKSRLQCAGMNRHEAENERVSRERTSDPLGLESCVATARDPTKRRQRIGGVGIQLRKDAIRMPTPL